MQTRLVLEPGNVYSLLVVMGDETTVNVPLRLTIYSPLAGGARSLSPLSMSW